ncbi:hypothetical protein OH491_23915 [Termitidicoccus mucosus]
MNLLMVLHSNPFFFESPSDRWSFTDREELTSELCAFMRQRGRRLLVHGLRRMGKTSLLLNAGRISKECLVFVDASAATSLNEVAQALLLAAPREEESLLPKLLRLARTHFASVSIDAGGIKLSGELRPEDGPKNLESVLTYLNARAGAEDKPWTICFDEFQDMRILGGGRIDWQLRSCIQHLRNVNFIFSGSDYRLVKWMTGPNAAFFRQLQMMEVGPIESALLIEWLAARAKTGGLARFPFGQGIVDMAGPRTGDIIRLAMVCFEIAAPEKTPEGQVVAKAFDMLTFTQMTHEFSARWHDCTLTQRALLRALAQGFAPTAAETVRKFGLRSSSTAQSAAKALAERQILVRDIKNEIKFDNPFFRHWCKTQGVQP